MNSWAVSDPQLEQRALELAREAFSAAREGDTSRLTRVLDLGLPANARNHNGDSLLMLASYHGHYDATPRLLARKAEPDSVNDKGLTPLQGAAFKGNSAMVTMLIEGGADPGATSPDGRTALMFAEMFGRDACAALLREALSKR